MDEKQIKILDAVKHCVYLMSQVKSNEEKGYVWERVYNTLITLIEDNKND